MIRQCSTLDQEEQQRSHHLAMKVWLLSFFFPSFWSRLVACYYGGVIENSSFSFFCCFEYLLLFFFSSRPLHPLPNNKNIFDFTSNYIQFLLTTRLWSNTTDWPPTGLVIQPNRAGADIALLYTNSQQHTREDISNSLEGSLIQFNYA